MHDANQSIRLGTAGDKGIRGIIEHRWQIEAAEFRRYKHANVAIILPLIRGADDKVRRSSGRRPGDRLQVSHWFFGRYYAPAGIRKACRIMADHFSVL